MVVRKEKLALKLKLVNLISTFWLDKYYEAIHMCKNNIKHSYSTK